MDINSSMKNQGYTNELKTAPSIGSGLDMMWDEVEELAEDSEISRIACATKARGTWTDWVV